MYVGEPKPPQSNGNDASSKKAEDDVDQMTDNVVMVKSMTKDELICKQRGTYVT